MFKYILYLKVEKTFLNKKTDPFRSSGAYQWGSRPQFHLELLKRRTGESKTLVVSTNVNNCNRFFQIHKFWKIKRKN